MTYMLLPTFDQFGMKRLRESGTLSDGVSGDNNKRRRLEQAPTAEDDREAEGLLHRCLSWLMNLSPQNRPRSVNSLKNGLKDICQLSYTVDPQVVFTHLLLNGVIGLDGNKVVFPQRPTHGNFQIFVPNDPFLQSGLDSRISSDFSLALAKAANWIRTNRGFSAGTSVTTDCFLHSLSQLCAIKKAVQPERVVEHFRIRGLVSYLPNGTIDYNLPQEVRPGHYMAFAHS